jgi:hypothetical protein
MVIEAAELALIAYSDASDGPFQSIATARSNVTRIGA